MNRQLVKLNEERAQIEDDLDRLTTQTAERDSDLDEAELATVAGYEERMAQIDAQLEILVKAEERRANAGQITARASAAEQQMRATAQLQVSEPDPVSFTTMGDAFVRSPQYADWMTRGGRGGSGKVEYRAGTGTLVRATLTEGSSPGSALLPQHQKVTFTGPDPRYPLLGLVNRIPVSTPSVELVLEGDQYGATGFATVAEGAKKPEAAITATPTTVAIPTRAAWVKASRALLEDAPAARSLIDGQLRRGYLKEVENHVAATIVGAAIPKVTGASKQPLLEVARVGSATVQAAGFNPTVLLVKPEDAAGIDLALYSKTFLGAMSNTGPWGLQVVAIPGLTKSVIIDPAEAVVLLERTGVQVFTTDSDQDDFLHNIITVLCEGRCQAVVQQPKAAVELVVTP